MLPTNLFSQAHFVVSFEDVRLHFVVGFKKGVVSAFTSDLMPGMKIFKMHFGRNTNDTMQESTAAQLTATFEQINQVTTSRKNEKNLVMEVMPFVRANLSRTQQLKRQQNNRRNGKKMKHLVQISVVKLFMISGFTLLTLHLHAYRMKTTYDMYM